MTAQETSINRKPILPARWTVLLKPYMKGIESEFSLTPNRVSKLVATYIDHPYNAHNPSLEFDAAKEAFLAAHRQGEYEYFLSNFENDTDDEEPPQTHEEKVMRQRWELQYETLLEFLVAAIHKEKADNQTSVVKSLKRKLLALENRRKALGPEFYRTNPTGSMTAPEDQDANSTQSRNGAGQNFSMGNAKRPGSPASRDQTPPFLSDREETEETEETEQPEQPETEQPREPREPKELATESEQQHPEPAPSLDLSRFRMSSVQETQPPQTDEESSIPSWPRKHGDHMFDQQLRCAKQVYQKHSSHWDLEDRRAFVRNCRYLGTTKSTTIEYPSNHRIYKHFTDDCSFTRAYLLVIVYGEHKFSKSKLHEKMRKELDWECSLDSPGPNKNNLAHYKVNNPPVSELKRKAAAMEAMDVDQKPPIGLLSPPTPGINIGTQHAQPRPQLRPAPQTQTTTQPRPPRELQPRGGTINLSYPNGFSIVPQPSLQAVLPRLAATEKKLEESEKQNKALRAEVNGTKTMLAELSEKVDSIMSEGPTEMSRKNKKAEKTAEANEGKIRDLSNRLTRIENDKTEWRNGMISALRGMG